MLFTEIALLCMLVGARRWAFAKTYRPRPCSTCIHAPMLRSTKVIQLRFHWSKAFVCRAVSTFWLIWRTTLEL